MTDNPKELADEAIAMRLLGDALIERSKDLATRAADALGRGTIYPKLGDGTELGCFNVPKGSIKVEVDLDLLTPWVREHYPEEIVPTVRASFVEALRISSKQAGQPAAPQGELDIPGLYVTTSDLGAPRITGYDAGKARARTAVESVLDRVIPAFATPELPGGTE